VALHQKYYCQNSGQECNLLALGGIKVSEGGLSMARPIEVTPVLKGRDAKEFLRQSEAQVMTPQRRDWLRSAAEESKKVERDK